MKVKYVWKNKDENILIYWNIYNVFSIEIDQSNNNSTLYIAWKDMNYVYPFYNLDTNKDYEIIDNSMSNLWKIWFDNTWNLIIWPKEVFEINSFWQDYYADWDDYQVDKKMLWM